MKFTNQNYIYTTKPEIIRSSPMNVDDVDTITVVKSYVADDSVLDVARAVQKQFPGSLKGVHSEITVVLKDTTISIGKDGGSVLKGFHGILEVIIIGIPETVMSVVDFFSERYQTNIKKRTSRIQLWYQTKDGSQSTTMMMEPYGDFHPEMYPWSSPDYFQRYLDSPASVLFLSGPPGTGKTSLLRHEITSRGIDIMATYDESVVQRDTMFLSFMTSSSINVLIIEDADSILVSRERERNSMMSRFLGFSEGLAKFPKKKIIFTTNLNDFSYVDPALRRPGRCFGVLNARALTNTEAQCVVSVANIKMPKLRDSYLLTELFNTEDNGSTRERKVGFK